MTASHQQEHLTDLVLGWIGTILRLAATVISVGLMLILLGMGIWPAPLKMQPGTPPINQWVVRCIALAGAGVMIPMIWLQCWLIRRRRKAVAALGSQALDTSGEKRG